MTSIKFDPHNLDFGQPIEVKFAPDESEAGMIAGYASTFGNTDRGGDIVARGAFTKSIGNIKPVMLWSHDASKPIGAWTGLREDSKGLFVHGRLDLNVQAAREAHSLIKSGAVNGMSIGYITKKSAREPKSGARELLEVELHEISLVALPMNEQARITGVKSLSLASEIEQLIRARGFPRSQAKAAAHVAFKSLCEAKSTTQIPSLIARIAAATAELKGR